MSKDSTKRRSFLGTALVLLASAFHLGANTKALTTANTHTPGMGWGGGAVYSPKRTKFKGYMRDPQYRAKRNKK